MKTTIGGDRLGSGNKQEVSLRTYNRSTHDLSFKWRSSMAAGTLVPFLTKVALPGDTFDIDLSCEVLTLPTVGPLFGSYKVQLDIFQVPIRIYNAQLHMNKLGIGMDMKSVLLPQLKFEVDKEDYEGDAFDDNAQTNPSSLLRYLGITGAGINNQANTVYSRWFNAVPLLGYWDIFKNYYANKQETVAYAVHTADSTARVSIIGASASSDGITFFNAFNVNVPISEAANSVLIFNIEPTNMDLNMSQASWERGGVGVSASSEFGSIVHDKEANTITCTNINAPAGIQTWNVPSGTITFSKGQAVEPQLGSFNLENIDTMKLQILQKTPITDRFEIDENSLNPYAFYATELTGGSNFKDQKSVRFPMEQLAVKTYQSDLFQNWIDTEWIDGANGVNEVTKVDTTGNAFTIDALNLAQKVYVMLNRIAISGGTYDDWLDAVYTHERAKSLENPVYHGSLIKELAFQEVISNAEVGDQDTGQPLGTLAGRGRLTPKHKGGSIKVKIHEPSYLMGIVSLTPRVDYSQGNAWDVNLATMDDFHKPALDAIGYQDLITDQMAWQETKIADSGAVTYKSAGKQPAWINYMTAVDKVYGNFADANKEMFMVLARRYETGEEGIEDLTTYIDPKKFNFIFAQSEFSAQNFWVQIGAKVIARRKMSAKVIPNL